jgi:hypothetical protein
MKPLVTVLEVERAHLFVGREREIARVTAWLQSSAAQSAVLAIQGVGGIGKSALLLQLLRVGAAHGATALRLDARASLGSPEGFLRHLDYLLRLGRKSRQLPVPSVAPSVLAITGLVQGGQRVILGIDNFDELVPLEAWLREEFVPALPEAGVLLVLATRRGVSNAWRADLAWRGRLIQMPLAALSRAEAREYVSHLDGASARRQLGCTRARQQRPPLPAAVAASDWTLMEDLRAALNALDYPKRLSQNPIAIRLGLDGHDFSAQLRSRLRSRRPYEPMTLDDQQLLRSAFGEGEPPEAVAARLYLSRATYYRRVRRALERLAASLPLD